MKQEVLNAFNAQIERERDAAEVYDGLSIWCSVNDYKGFAEFFKKQAGEERSHIDKLVEHLIDRGQKPKLTSLEAPPTEYPNLEVAAEAALAHEKSNTHGIHETLKAAHAAEDFAAVNLLNWFAGEQVEEEAWANRMVTLIRRALCAGSMYALDRHIVSDLTGKD